MTQLKTLKDIDKETLKTGEDVVYRLRAEAIKWIKEPDEVSPLTRGWIKHFFGITEGDLK